MSDSRLTVMNVFTFSVSEMDITEKQTGEKLSSPYCEWDISFNVIKIMGSGLLELVSKIGF